MMAAYGVVAPEGGFVIPAKELSDEELSAVAGGSGGGTAYLTQHTECICAIYGDGIALDTILCLCPLAGGGVSKTNPRHYTDETEGCDCVLGGYGVVAWEY